MPNKSQHDSCYHLRRSPISVSPVAVLRANTLHKYYHHTDLLDYKKSQGELLSKLADSHMPQLPADIVNKSLDVG